ncbi:transporter substrate-binding domain-containing protein [Desulfovibrio mangrovi]|nr:transporter substrate-binding domain-containing protein [Desulfovibrio mangrovi]UZP69147.1 transporter substrate-binding domain-containing protein [Desulfovibrio mangrovi]
MERDGRAEGIDIEVVTELCARIGYSCDIETYPWNRVLSNVETGFSDAGFSAFYTKERAAYATYLQYPIHNSIYSVFVLKGSEFTFSCAKDLFGKRIGTNRGFCLGDEFAQAASEGRFVVEEVGDTDSNIQKLLHGRLDCIVANYYETMTLLDQQGLAGRVVALPVPVVPPKGAYLIVSKMSGVPERDALIARMNEALKGMYEDGTVDRITEKYLKVKQDSR